MISNWKRARLYLFRKKNKSIILLAILTVIASLVLVCISIGNATDTASRNLRETIGGYFKIVTNTEKGYSKPVDDALIQSVMESEKIKSYNGLDTIYMLTNTLSLTPGRFTAAGDSKAKLTRFIGNTDSSLNEYFVLRSFSLIEGRHLKQDDIGKCLISKEIALNNHLSIGDSFSVTPNAEGLSEEQQEAAQPYTFEVTGIYEINTTQASNSADSAECDIAENFIFINTASIRAIYEPILSKKLNSYQNGATFFVNDPKELDQITEQLLSLDNYNWDGYKITKNNEAYIRSSVPLGRVSSLLKTIIIALAVISILLLSLILAMWMRDRLHEIGILLSIGVKKLNIIGQHVLENLLVTTLALLLAWGIASITANKLGDILFSNMSEESVTVSMTEGYNRADPIETPEIETESLIQINVGRMELLEVAGIGFLIVILSTAFSSSIIIHMKPKEILSRMS